MQLELYLPMNEEKCYFVCVCMCVCVHMNEKFYFLMNLCQSAGLCNLLSCSMNKAAFLVSDS